MRAEPCGVRAGPTSPWLRAATPHLHHVTFALAALRLVEATPCLVAFMIQQEEKEPPDKLKAAPASSF